MDNLDNIEETAKNIGNNLKDMAQEGFNSGKDKTQELFNRVSFAPNIQVHIS